MHAMLCLKPLPQLLRKSCSSCSLKRDYPTSKSLCSFEELGVCAELSLLSLTWSYSVSWLRGHYRCREQRVLPNKSTVKLGIYLGVDKTVPCSGHNQNLTKNKELRENKVMCFHFTAGHHVQKENCLRKKKIWHLPLSKVNMYIENIFSQLLVGHTADNFLLICLNFASVFSSVSHSTDVFSIWHSKT